MKTKKKDMRVQALIRFASAITILNILGYSFLGFENSYAHPFVALLTGYSIELLLEFILAKTSNRTPKYAGGAKQLFIFLLPAHITSLAVSMLIFTNENLWGVVFAVSAALLSKVIFRVTYKGKSVHFLNPSNTGIAIAFIVFPWIGSAPPYQFTEFTSGVYDWILAGILVALGSFLNYRFTKKHLLIIAWLVTYFAQAVIRTQIFGTDTVAAIAPMSGLAFLLFTFYMVSDPSTTPFSKRGQIIFGSSVAIVYGITMELHLVFNLFWSLFIVCATRGLILMIMESKNKSEKMVISNEKIAREFKMKSKENAEVVLNTQTVEA